MSKNQGRFAASRGKKKNRVWMWILLVILVLLLAAVVAACVVVMGTLNKINRVDPTETTISPEQAETMDFRESEDLDPEEGEDGSDITWPTQNAELIGETSAITNILLIGQDRRPGEARARSDSMILLSINQEKKTITMISFLRDNYVQIPGGYRDNRLNVSYALGGMELLDETLAVNFGVKIDYNIEVDFDAFERVVNLMGGVDIELTGAEAAYINRNQGSLTAGMNHLNGQQALTYARIRKLDSDFGRTNRQRTVLKSLANSVRNISLSDAMALADEVLPLVTTDMSNKDIISCITEFLPILAESGDFQTVSIPGDSDYYNATIRGMMVLVPDLESARTVLAEYLK